MPATKYHAIHMVLLTVEFGKKLLTVLKAIKYRHVQPLFRQMINK